VQGWIKLHRSIKKHWIYNSKEPFTQREAWIDLLLEVNHSEQKVNIGGTLFVCGVGESLNSLDTWGDRWKWNKSKVRRFFKLLESDSMIVTKSERKTTRLTIVNYSTYQVERNTDETQTKRKRNADETQATPNKNDKNDKNEKNDKNTLEERKKTFQNRIVEANDNRKVKCSRETLNEFYSFWSEIGDNDKKMKFEKTRSFNTSRRLTTWVKNNYNGTETVEPAQMRVFEVEESALDRMIRLSQESNN
jgi:hypothetical protein